MVPPARRFDSPAVSDDPRSPQVFAHASWPHWILRAIIYLLGALLLLLARADLAGAHLSLIRQGADCAEIMEGGDEFGSALAVGDFNGDGYDDLAVGAPEEDVNGVNGVGAVVVIYGSAKGLTHMGAVVRTAQSIGAPVTAGMHFGAALASGDFNDNGFDDLAIGAPDAPVSGTADVGRVFILPGSAAGLGALPVAFIDQSWMGGAQEVGDDFGASFAVGNFNPDSYDDLAIGGPGEDGGTGAVFHVYGTNSGLDPAGADFLKQSDLGGVFGATDRFGTSLAAGNLFGGPEDDLAMGAPFRAVGPVGSAGAIYVVHGGAGGLTSAGYEFYNAGLIDGTEAGASFGFALAAGVLRFSDSGHASLAIGEPGRDVGGVLGAGRVLVIQGSDSGLDLDLRNILTEPVGQRGASDLFGEALAVGAWNAGNYDDLAIGGRAENITTAAGLQGNAGQVRIYLGGVGGPGPLLQVTQENLGEASEPSDEFGTTLAFGAFDDGGTDNLAAGAPLENTSNDVSYACDGCADVDEFTNAGQVFIIAPSRQPQLNLVCRNSIVTDCEGEIIFSQRPFDRVRVASTTKVMTLLIAAERSQLPVSDPKYVSLDEEYEIPPWLADTTKVTTTRWGLNEDEVWTLRDLMKVTLAMSGNDCAYAIADLLTGANDEWVNQTGTVPEFVAEMNARADALGMVGTPISPRTRFRNPAGKSWGDPYSTAWDMAKLMRAAMANPVFSQMANVPTHSITIELPSGVRLRVPVTSAFASWTGLTPAINGYKPGGTTASQKTGMYSSAAGAGADNTIGTFFGWPLSTAFATRRADVLAVLTLGTNDCGAVPAGRATAPLHATGTAGAPLHLVTGIVTAQDSLHRSGVSVDTEDDSLTIVVQRQGGSGNAALDLRVSRGTEVPLGPGASVPFGIAPLHGHAGFLLVNQESTVVNLLITLSHPPMQQSVVLGPYGSLALPPYSGPAAPSFNLSIANLSTTNLADLAVEELGYGFPVTLPASPPGAFVARLRRGSGQASEFVRFETTGQDANLGNTVSLALYAGVGPVGVTPPPSRPGGAGAVHLHSPRPQPSSGSVRIAFDLHRSGSVEVALFDIQGRLVRRLSTPRLEPGSREVDWDGADQNGGQVPPGVYLVRLSLDGRAEADGKVLRIR